MTNKEQILQKQLTSALVDKEELQALLRSQEDLENHISRLQDVISKYNQWFQFNKDWVEIYNANIRWNTETGKADIKGKPLLRPVFEEMSNLFK